MLLDELLKATELLLFSSVLELELNAPLLDELDELSPTELDELLDWLESDELLLVLLLVDRLAELLWLWLLVDHEEMLLDEVEELLLLNSLDVETDCELLLSISCHSSQRP